MISDRVIVEKIRVEDSSVGATKENRMPDYFEKMENPFTPITNQTGVSESLLKDTFTPIPKSTLNIPRRELTGKELGELMFSILDRNKDGKIDIPELNSAPPGLKNEAELVKSKFERISNLSNDDWGKEKNLSQKDLIEFFRSDDYKLTKFKGFEKQVADELTKALFDGDLDDFLVTLRKLHGKPVEAKNVLSVLAGALTERGHDSTCVVRNKGTFLTINHGSFLTGRYQLTVGTSGTAEARYPDDLKPRNAFDVISRSWQK